MFAGTTFRVERLGRCRCAIRVQTCDSARAASCWHSCALIQFNAGTTLVGAYIALCSILCAEVNLTNNDIDTHRHTSIMADR